MGERGAQPGRSGTAAVARSEVQQQVRGEAVPVGQAVDRDDRLDEVVLPAEVVGGAQRAGAANIADPGRLAGSDPVPADHQAGMGTLAAPRHHDLGRDVAARGTVGVKEHRGRVAGQHAPALDQPVAA